MVLVAILNIVAVTAYLVLVRSRVGPFIDNDEYIYGNLAQSLAGGHGATWRGVDPGLRTIYPYVIAPAWALADGIAGYRLTQAIGVLLLCSIVWPVWFAARQLSPGRSSLVAPVLAVIGVWMVESARVMTEALALPAATWSLCLAIVALCRERRGWMVAAVGFALLAGMARVQAGAVLAAITLGLTLDVLRRAGQDRAATARSMRPEMMVLWGLVVIGTVLAAGPLRSKLGSYGEVVGKGSPLGEIGRFAADHVTDIVLLTGIVPWIGVLGLALTRQAWRSDVTGPFVSVFVAASIVFIVVAGWFGATVSDRTIERYVEYVAPVVVVGILPALRMATWRAALAAGVVTALLAGALGKEAARGHVAPALHAYGELLGWPAAPASGQALPIVLLILAVTAMVAAGLWWRDRTTVIEMRSRAVPVGAIVVPLLLLASGVGLALGSTSAWHAEQRQSTLIRDAFGRIPDSVDQRLAGAGTIVVDTLPPPVPLWIEFFNEKIDRLAADAPQSDALGAGYGPSCRYRTDTTGRFAPGACTSGRRSYVFMTATGVVPTLRGGGAAKTVGLPFVYVVDGPPRLLALRQPICDETTGACRRATITTFAERPAKLMLRFTGPQQPHQVVVGGREYTIEPGAPTSITIPVPAGRHETAIQGDWPALLLGVPELDRATLQEAGNAPVRLN